MLGFASGFRQFGDGDFNSETQLAFLQVLQCYAHQPHVDFAIWSQFVMHVISSAGDR